MENDIVSTSILKNTLCKLRMTQNENILHQISSFDQKLISIIIGH